MRFRKPFIILSIVSFLVSLHVKIYAEDEISVGPEEKIYYDTWSNLFSISEESKEEYLPEEDRNDYTYLVGYEREILDNHLKLTHLAKCSKMEQV